MMIYRHMQLIWAYRIIQDLKLEGISTWVPVHVRLIAPARACNFVHFCTYYGKCSNLSLQCSESECKLDRIFRWNSRKSEFAVLCILTAWLGSGRSIREPKSAVSAVAQEFTERLTELRSGALVWTMGHKWLRRGRGSPAPLVPGATTSWTVPPGCLKLALVASGVMFAVLLDVLVLILLGVPAALFIVLYRHSASTLTAASG